MGSGDYSSYAALVSIALEMMGAGKGGGASTSIPAYPSAGSLASGGGNSILAQAAQSGSTSNALATLLQSLSQKNGLDLPPPPVSTPPYVPQQYAQAPYQTQQQPQPMPYFGGLV